jgi:hypothetical protein
VNTQRSRTLRHPEIAGRIRKSEADLPIRGIRINGTRLLQINDLAHVVSGRGDE